MRICETPEQLHEQPAFTPASDVFSLGTVLARLALGRSPWGRDTPSVVANIRAGTSDLGELPKDLERVVRSCLHPDPDQRPTAADVAEALVPGAGDGRIDPPPLSEQARTLVTEAAIMPATRHYETLARTRAHAAEDATWAAPRVSPTVDATATAPSRDPAVQPALAEQGE